MKTLFFSLFALAAILSLAGINTPIVGIVGCISALAFSTIVFYQIYKAWIYENK